MVVTRRAIALLRRGTWDREIHGFVFSIDEKDCWYFVPDAGEDETGCATFFGISVKTTAPDNDKDFRPKAAVLLCRMDMEEGMKALKDALEGL